MVANFIHGECVTGSGQRVQAIFNPATGKQIRQVVMSTAQETEQAIAAAQQAFPAWARHAPLKRARVMFRFKALLEENMDRPGPSHQRRARQGLLRRGGRTHPWSGSGGICLRYPASAKR